ncbi:tetratricopeptide repeat protein [Mesobacillus jeotgali]|uniref:tetratricopeptide repeat protein n=1 Tax=Mesobacillus jeotgali TaxID=129985 RepID=UPI0017839FFF|nr:tetratricopeptide repeat protein [Mesobacillus jeotgali]UYZ23297.1 tetratricopeptide repeat protein [Mesobacillus jeotgali]
MKLFTESIYDYLYQGFQANSSKPEVSDYLELNDNTLVLLLEQTVFKRINQGTEYAYIFLDSPNRKFSSSLKKELLFKYYYMLVLLNFERYDRELIEKNYSRAQLYFDADLLGQEWEQRFLLISALCGTASNRVMEGINPIKALKSWLSLYNSPNSLVFSVNIYFGSWCVKNENFKEAEDLLSKSLSQASSPEQYAIAYSNLGALAYSLDDLQKAIELYQKALIHIDDDKNGKLGNEKLHIMLYENQKNIEIQEAARKDEWYYPDQIPLNENIFDFANRMRRIGLNYLTDEVFNENIKGRNSYRASNNLYESVRYLERAELSYQLLGDVQGLKKLSKEQMMHFLNSGSVLKEDVLKRIALEHAILINNDKTIKGLIGDSIPFNTLKEIGEFCEWLFDSGVNRLTRLGRAHCIGLLADYLPNKFVEPAYHELLKTLDEKWSFTKDFDYKRTAIEALRRLVPRLKSNQKSHIIHRIWQAFLQGPHLVKEHAAKNLSEIKDWQGYPSISDLSGNIRNEIDKISSDSLEYKSLIILLLNITKFATEEKKIEITRYLEEKSTNGNWYASSIVLNSHLTPFAKKKTKEQAVIDAIKQVEQEIKEESLNSYSMKSYFWGAVLAFLLPYIDDSPLFKRAEDILYKYIESTNVMSLKRSEAVQAVFYLLKNHPDLKLDFVRLQTTCQNCLDDPRTWLDEKSTFLSNDHSLVPEIFKVLSQLEISDREAESLMHSFLGATLMFEKDSLSDSLIAMTTWAKRWYKVPAIYAPILARIYMECKNDDPVVRAAAIYGLLELAEMDFPDDVNWYYAMHAIKIGSRDKSRNVRYNLAKGLSKLKEKGVKRTSEIDPFINELHRDLSFIVREASQDEKKVQS